MYCGFQKARRKDIEDFFHHEDMTEVTINKVKKIHRMQDNICK
jgi:hypothetical protein